MATFHLYRIRSIPMRSHIEPDDHVAGEVLLTTVLQEPDEHLTRGGRWRIGNIARLNEYVILFAFGRISRTSRIIYEEEVRNFVEEKSDEAPYTFVLLDTEYQLCAIARNAAVAQNTDSIARSLQNLINFTIDPNQAYLEFRIDVVNNPVQFLDLIRSAYRIRKVDVTLRPPNPFDVDDQFHKPMELVLREANASGGKISLNGEKLDPKFVETITKSATAGGDRVTARIQSEQGQEATTVRTVGNPVTFNAQSPVGVRGTNSLVTTMRDIYRRVRGLEP